MDKSQLSLRFTNFANNECRDSSLLYEHLSLKVSEDDEMLGLCLESQNRQPVPNLFFGAVHYLLLKGIKHHLKVYYPTLTEVSRNIDDDTFVYLKDFCKSNRAEIVAILNSKLVQTNEVRRCAETVD